MKKIFILALAPMVMSLAACGNRTGNTAELDSLFFVAPTEDADVVEQANIVVTLLEEQLQDVDPEQIQAVSNRIAEQVAGFISAGDEKALEQYVAIISDFISKNAMQMQEAGVPVAIAAALASVKGISSDVVGMLSHALSKVDTTTTSAQQAVNATQQVIDAMPETVKGTVKQQTAKIVDEAATAAKKELGL